MCAIAGFLQTGEMLSDPEGTIRDMADVQHHRGPDGGGVWLDPGRRVALGHRRLKVLDLSPAGDQPMVSPSGRFTIVFSGEIYNHHDLRAELDVAAPGQGWRGRSDTETLLAAVDQWGLKGALVRAIGMFALAIWDARDRTLGLARDRMGEKPLYYGRRGGTFLFASELTAFRVFPGFDAAIDQDAVGLFLWYNYIPAPRSIFRDAKKLSPGTIMTIDSAGKAREESYWSLDTALHAPRFAGSAQDAADQVEALLRDSVRRQSIADVPVGAFLSGGVDSAAVVAMMCETGAAVKTFSLGFADFASDEGPYARAVAARLGTAHTDMIMDAEDARALIPRLPRIWDEPFADSSQIPTAMVAMLARRQVTVSLTGDGGDELFCGYPSYRVLATRERWPAKRALSAILKAMPPGPFAAGLRRVGFEGMNPRRLKKLAHQWSLDDPWQRFLSSVCDWDGEPGVAPGLSITPLALAEFPRPPDIDPATYFSFIDARTYLVDDLLVKVDRAAMAASLETRLPLLDHRLVELAFRLPSSIKIRGGRAKWPLRSLLDKYLPRTLVDRPKHGFSIPLADWLRGPLREWADDLLSPASLGRIAAIDASAVSGLWEEHRTGAHDHSRRLWTILMLQAWYQANGD
jgi:asparagine synthase (glutamine-hydrolysing)